MLVDPTAHKEAEEALRLLNETLEQRVEERTRQLSDALTQLRESERRFRLFVDGVTDYAIFMLDTKGVITNWNFGSRADQRLSGSRDHWSAFLRVLHLYGSTRRVTAARIDDCGSGQKIRGRWLASAQGWFAVLGERGHGCRPR
jgi:PAS domain-containing protein